MIKQSTTILTVTNKDTTKLALGIEYDGSAYHGWQRQQEVPSVQWYLERALSIIAGESVTIFCAGRTDAGVHATGQVVHFKTSAHRTDTAWTVGVNANLPIDIAVLWVIPVPKDFHARLSATSRRYRYIIYNHFLRPALFNNGLFHYYYPLDVKKMSRSGQYLLGENDFTSFRAIQCQSFTPWRKVYHLHVTKLKRYIIIDIKANSFVHYMVRNIVGSLIEVGCGNKPETWIYELLKKRNRAYSGNTAPAKGLYLVEVNYPARFKFPVSPGGPLFLDD